MGSKMQMARSLHACLQLVLVASGARALQLGAPQLLPPSRSCTGTGTAAARTAAGTQLHANGHGGALPPQARLTSKTTPQERNRVHAAAGARGDTLLAGESLGAEQCLVSANGAARPEQNSPPALCGAYF